MSNLPPEFMVAAVVIIVIAASKLLKLGGRGCYGDADFSDSWSDGGDFDCGDCD